MLLAGIWGSVPPHDLRFRESLLHVRSPLRMIGLYTGVLLKKGGTPHAHIGADEIGVLLRSYRVELDQYPS